MEMNTLPYVSPGRFEAQAEATLMKFEHRDLESEESAQQHTHGWTSSFEKLGPHLSA